MLTRAARLFASRQALRRTFHSLLDLGRPGPEKIWQPPIELIYFPSQASAGLMPSKRILFVGPRYDYGDPRRGIGIEENFFLHTLVAMGHQVVRFDPLALMQAQGRSTMNQMLLEIAMRFSPDVAFMVMFREELEPDVVDTLTADLHGRTVNWFCDDQWRFEDYSRRWAPHFGRVVTTSRAAFDKYRAVGLSNVILSQWGCNHFLYKPLGGVKDIAVSFVGQPHGDRANLIQQLTQAGIPIKTFGFGWPSGKITQSSMIRLFSRTRINLNLSNASVAGSDQVKGRDFEIPGCRGFVITKNTAEIGDYYVPGREIETYEDPGSLLAKVRYYLAHPDQAAQIANSGYLRTIASHTMERRLSEVLVKVLNEQP